jgi:hypothetical protein
MSAMHKLLISTVVSLLWVAPAMAQTGPEEAAKPSVTQNPPTAGVPNRQQTDEQGAQSIQEQLINQLAGAGLTDIEMMPMSFAVHAKDAAGNPVWLTLSPNGASEWQANPLDGEDDRSTSLPNQERF